MSGAVRTAGQKIGKPSAIDGRHPRTFFVSFQVMDAAPAPVFVLTPRDGR